MKANFVTRIGPEVALPAARAYCMRQKLAYDYDAGWEMQWNGAIVRGSLRACVGLADIGEGTMFVSGLFTDGSEYEYEGAKLLAGYINELPCAFVGRLHLPTCVMRRLFSKSGWLLGEVA